MDIVYERCAGMDVHKDTVVVCVVRSDAGGRAKKEIKTFGTMTKNLWALATWLAQEGVTHVAMESTGVFWKPIFNILEAQFEILLVNARHIKNVPGRKTDVKDCEWIADLLRHGLLKASFVPDRPQRELRDLTRHRVQLTGEHTRTSNRIQKILEDANIKLASVASDVLGTSGRQMIQALLAGNQEPSQMADLARGRMRSKKESLTEALEGHVTEHHRFMLRTLWEHLLFIEKTIATMDARIEEQMRPFEAEIQRLDGITGVDRVVAQALIAEVGVDMSRFATDDHLASWAGICPGNHQSAGKRKSGSTPKANRWLKRALGQAAWAASHSKNTYLSSQFRQIAKRRGKKRATIAVAHTILTAAYHVLRKGVEYHELGADYFDRLHPDRLRQYYVKRLQKLGFQVAISETTTAA